MLNDRLAYEWMIPSDSVKEHIVAV